MRREASDLLLARGHWNQWIPRRKPGLVEKFLQAAWVAFVFVCFLNCHLILDSITEAEAYFSCHVVRAAADPALCANPREVDPSKNDVDVKYERSRTWRGGCGVGLQERRKLSPALFCKVNAGTVWPVFHSGALGVLPVRAHPPPPPHVAPP